MCDGKILHYLYIYMDHCSIPYSQQWLIDETCPVHVLNLPFVLMHDAMMPPVVTCVQSTHGQHLRLQVLTEDESSPENLPQKQHQTIRCCIADYIASCGCHCRKIVVFECQIWTLEMLTEDSSSLLQKNQQH